MFKFLRKYNKWILAVGGVLLLITFLIPFAFEQLGTMAARRGAAWARVGADQRKVDAAELATVQRELRVVQYWPLLPGPGRVDNAAHWFLLCREAAESGLIEAPSTVGTDQLDAQMLPLGGLSGESEPFVIATLAKWKGVRRMIDMYLDAGKYSDRRLLAAARRGFYAASAELVVIPAREEDADVDPTEGELAEQMAAYADVAPGAGEMGFGYRLPDRVKVEWLAVPAQGVRAAIEESDRLDPVALRRHWRLNSRGAFPPPDAGAEVPDVVRRDLLETLTAEALQEIARFGYDQIRIRQRGLGLREGYLDLPPGWQGLPFPELAGMIQEKFGIDLPEYHAPGDRWLSAQECGELPAVGSATTDKFGRAELALPAIVSSLRELRPDPAVPLQQNVAGPPLRGADGSVYFFRVLDADKSRPPRSVDEVRERLVSDLRRLAAYRELEARAPTIRLEAIEKGLATVAMQHGTRIQTAGRLTLTDLSVLLAQSRLGQVPGASASAIPGLGSAEEAVEAIIDHALSLPEAQAMRDLSEEDRVLAVPVAQKLCLLLVRLTGRFPVTRETFATYTNLGITQQPLLRRDLGAAGDPAAEAFGLEAIAARHAFTLASGAPLVPQGEGEEILDLPAGGSAAPAAPRTGS